MEISFRLHIDGKGRQGMRQDSRLKGGQAVHGKFFFMVFSTEKYLMSVLND